MGLLDVNAQEAQNTPDPVTLPTGTEALLEIIQEPEIREKDETGTKWLSITLAVVEHDNQEITGEIAPIFHSIFLPQDGDNPQRAASNRRKMRDFLAAFDIEVEGDSFDPAMTIGKQSWAVLKEEHSDKYDDQNSIRRFVQAK